MFYLGERCVRAKLLWLIFYSMGFCFWAQNSVSDSIKIDSLDLSELMLLKQTSEGSELEKEMDQSVNSSSARRFSLRNSPNVIILITEEEIRNSGAKDLLEVMGLFNCVDFNVDVQGIVGFNYRGLPANEGKIQILLDGFEINEMAYNSFFLGGEYDMSLIHKVELIKGSGSAIYGGNASYCVVNIISKVQAKKDGLLAHTNAGVSQKGFSNYGLSTHFSKTINNNLHFGLQGAVSRNYRTDKVYTDVYGNSKDFSDSAFQDAYLVNGKLSYKGFYFASLLNIYNTFQADNYQKVLNRFTKNNMFNFANKLGYDWEINKNNQINFSLLQRYNRPYFSSVLDSTDAIQYKVNLNRYSAKVLYHYSYNNWFDFISLNDYFFEYNVKLDADFPDGGRLRQYQNFSTYSEFSFKTKFVNIIGGLRYNKHSIVKDVFIPRISLLKKIKLFNYKIIYSKGYRLPALENFVNAIGEIRPEDTDSYDFEVGYQFSPKLYTSANYFKLLTNNPLFYSSDGATGLESYINSSAAGTQGFEFNAKWRDKRGYFNLRYQYITNAGQPTNIKFLGDSVTDINLGSSQHKVSLYSNYDLNSIFSIAPTVSYLSERYAFVKEETEVDALQKIKPQVLLNLYLHANHVFKSHFSVSIGVNNALNEAIVFPQAYIGNHAPLPGMGREFRFKLSYQLK
jgi:outer membrane receptor for ferrienterochelin and colicin